MRLPDLYDEVTGEPLWLHLPGEPIPEGGLRVIGTMISAEEVSEMQPATSTGLVYHSLPDRIIFTVSGQPGVGHAEVLMQGKVATGTQQLDMSTIRHIEIVTSTWRT